MKKKPAQKKKGGFNYYRSKKQILEYMKVSAERKLKWLEEMWQFNQAVGRSNPSIRQIQEKFRRGEI